MNARMCCVALILVCAGFVALFKSTQSSACCAVGPSGKSVVNADQSVIIIWDAASKTQHFIRKATFKSEADDFGFLVPTPNQPELEESGNEAFPFLAKLTEPEIRTVKRPRSGGGCACAMLPTSSRVDSAALPEPNVQVLVQKEVAGFDAVVLEAESAGDLVKWLEENGYAFSPEVEAWAKPYVEQGWKITALKVAKSKETAEQKDVAAAALRMSFKTDRPLFPYREPDSQASAETLGARRRLLRIFFLGDARFEGELTEEVNWTGKVAWSNPIQPRDWQKTRELLKLPEIADTEKWWLTEFEDNWPYQVAPADVYFTPNENQARVKRPPIIRYISAPSQPDVTMYAMAAFLFLTPPIFRRMRRRNNVVE